MRPAAGLVSTAARTERLGWDELVAGFDWLRDLARCPQDPVFHAEGDVLIHTRLVAEALLAGLEWMERTQEDRETLLWAALLHDVAKPATTRIEGERVTARGHSRRGQIMARRILWELGLPIAQRERICHLITHHQVPLFVLERERPERLVHLISHQTRCDLLAVLARADVDGRSCPDAARLKDNIALFEELAREERCYATPRDFASDHSRFLYFRTADRDASYRAHDDWPGRVTMLSGLPASGKDTWLRQIDGDASVVSLDALREELGIAPDEDQGAVLAAAREQAKVALRAHRPLIWNATNLGRERRRTLIDLFADYRAKVTIIYCETTPAEARRRNRERKSPVPVKAIGRMLDHWEPPDLTEAHEVRIVSSE